MKDLCCTSKVCMWQCTTKPVLNRTRHLLAKDRKAQHADTSNEETCYPTMSVMSAQIVLHHPYISKQ